MHPEQQQAILTIALLAAFADGANAEREREQIRRLAESLAETEGAPDLPALYQKVLLKQASLADTAAVLPDPSLRQLAYEMAVGALDVPIAYSLPLESATLPSPDKIVAAARRAMRMEG